MIAVDTNILARFYVQDPSDPEAAKQRPIALRVLSESSSLFVPTTVVLELEWVLRAFYGFGSAEFVQVIRHLIGLPNVHLQDWGPVHSALEAHLEGLDFADALHLASCAHCTEFLTFDDKRFARKANRLPSRPKVNVPA
jgi:predicted nucleic-acid-binding protein